MSRTLHDITDDVLALDAILVESDGEVADEKALAWIEQWMQENDAALSTKVDNYCALIVEYEKRAEARQAEAARLAAKARTEADRAKWLRDRLKDHFQRMRCDRMECPRFTVSVQRNGGMQPVEITGDVPTDYRIVKSEPDKAAIRTALLDGRDLPFARLLPRGESLRIR